MSKILKEMEMGLDLSPLGNALLKWCAIVVVVLSAAGAIAYIFIF